VTRYRDFTGTTVAQKYVEVRARVEGFLQSSPFDEGTRVEKGDLLFEIDPATYEASVSQAEAAVEQAKAKAEKAKWELERLKAMAAEQAANKKEVQDATAEDLSAKAEVSAAEASLKQANLDLGYTKIHAPIGGRIDRRQVDVGNLVGSGERTLLTNIIDDDPVYAYFDLTERELLEIIDGQPRDSKKDDHPPAMLGVATDEGFPHQGNLDFIENVIDPDTGTVKVRGVFPNADRVLFGGLFVRIRVPGDVIEGAVLVQEEAIGTDLGGKYLAIVGEKNIVERRAIVVGKKYGELVMINEGLKAGETYIVKGLQRARIGLPVDPEPMKAEGGTPAEADAPADAEGPTEADADPGPDSEPADAAATDPSK
jgi:RND family efflux transporter MFP subunit